MDQLRILLFVTPTANNAAVSHELTTGLAHSLSDMAEPHLHTSLHEIGLATLNAYDLIHIFGAWTGAAVRLRQQAHKLHVPTVYSPLGAFQPWNIKTMKRLPGCMMQKNATQKTSAVHLCSLLESNTFNSLGWNKRCATIANPVITSRITFAEMGTQMARLYQQVLDTHARLLLSPESKQAIGNLVQIGVDQDALLDRKHSDRTKETIAKLTETDWRRLMIYAEDENIIPLIEKALDKIGFEPPQINPQTITRFRPAQENAPGELKSDTLCFKNTSLKAKLHELIKEKENNEHRLCVELLNLKHEAEHHKASMLHLANIYSTLRFCEMDEDRLNEIVGEMNMSGFAARLMTVLHNVLNLTEGFMPFSPRDDRRAEKLERDITKFNTWA